MNDRFKYRVWDKENKCMHYPTRYSNFAIVNGTVVKIESYPTANNAYLGKRIAWEFDDAVIMQCTGLKDKNGKLIYEGDIVKLDDELNYIAQLHNKYDMDYGRIEFILIGGLPKYPTIYIPTVANESKVIGNIYKNKELLNESINNS